jgi:hypothetical protein
MKDPISAADEIRQYAEPLVRGGSMDFESIVQHLAYNICYDNHECGEGLLPVAYDIARKAIKAHIAEQASWPKITDCDRLTMAFEALEEEGIVCRENLSCCTRCGYFEIGAEIEELIEEDEEFEPTGYAFYHEQDVESAVEGDEFAIAFGSWHAGDAGDAASRAVGRKVVKAIRAQGLKVQWNRTADQRIKVSLDWKKRWAHGAPRRKPQR